MPNIAVFHIIKKRSFSRSFLSDIELLLAKKTDRFQKPVSFNVF